VNYLHYDLGNRSRGEIVEVNLRGSAANVLLLDSSNFSAFKAGRRHQYRGGHARRSPIRLVIPSTGRWYVVVHTGGIPATVRAGVRVLPGALPNIREVPTSSLDAIRDAADNFVPQPDEGLPEIEPDAKAYDVFISHASEDKDDVVRPLAHALRELGLAVWFDEFELQLGDSLRRKIDSGLARSRFGVVVLSPAFFAKEWPGRELDGLVSREIAGSRQIILPIWHEVSLQDVVEFSPPLGDKLALSTGDNSIDELAMQIAQVARRMDTDAREG
jgi:hypothetical protein